MLNLNYIKKFSKDIRHSFYFLCILYKNAEVINFLNFLIIVDQLKNKNIKDFIFKSIKYEFYKKILGKEKKFLLKKRFSISNLYVVVNVKKKRGVFYTLYKGNKKKQKCLYFDIISEKSNAYKWVFLYAFLPQSIFKTKIEKLFRLPKYKKFFIWPFYITIKPKVIIFKNIFFRNFFILKYKYKSNILSWVECKNKYKSTELLLNKAGLIHFNILNNYFIKQNNFSINNKIIKNNKSSSKFFNSNICKNYLNYMLNKNINGYFYFLKIILNSFKKIKISPLFYLRLFKILMKIIKREVSFNKKKVSHNLNTIFCNSNNKIFNKANSTKEVSFFKFKKYIRKYAKKSLLNYSFFLRLYMLYFFWFIFFFNKIFYFFNKILFNFWFRFFYFINSSLNVNNKLFFFYQNLYKSLDFTKYINFYFEFENIFINFLSNIINTFYWNAKNILVNGPYKKYFSKYFFLYFLFIFRNYFFLNIYYIYNKYLKNVINKSFILENNLFDSLYSNNYKYNTVYNKNYFVINGIITKKFNRFYDMPFKKRKKLSIVKLLDLDKLEQKRKNTLFLY